jgi:transposase
MKEIRNLFFKGKICEEISTILSLPLSRVKSIVCKKKYVDKRRRYHLFLVKYAYRNNLQIKEIAIMTGINVLTLTKIKRQYKVKTKRFVVPNKRITDEVRKGMIDLYNAGLSSSKVAKHFGYKTNKTVLDVLSYSNVSKRRGRCDYTSYNKDVFRRIDSHEKAYILGLLYTDGYIIRDYIGVAIQLTESDSYLLENIAKIFGSSSKVKHINCDTKRKSMPNCKDMTRLSVYCPEIALDLKLMGVTKRKTYDLSIGVKIYKKYIYSFARGVIDGDGTIGIYGKSKSMCCKFTTKSEKFALDFCNLPFDESFNLNKANGMYNVYVAGGRKKVTSFLKKMYQHKSNLYLERKYAVTQNQIC